MMVEHEQLLKLISKAETQARKIHTKTESIRMVREFLKQAADSCRQRIAHYSQNA